ATRAMARQRVLWRSNEGSRAATRAMAQQRGLWHSNECYGAATSAMARQRVLYRVWEFALVAGCHADDVGVQEREKDQGRRHQVHVKAEDNSAVVEVPPGPDAAG